MNAFSPSLIWVFLAGLAVGGAYFAGLNLTVRRLVNHKGTAALLVASFLVRSAAAVGCIYLATRGEPVAVIVCLAGFFAARMAWVRLWRPALPG